MSHDCPLAIRHKKGEYIHMEIGGEFCRLYMGFMMYFLFILAYDVFHFGFDIWVVYVRGRHYVYVFLLFLVSHMVH